MSRFLVHLSLDLTPVGYIVVPQKAQKLFLRVLETEKLFTYNFVIISRSSLNNLVSCSLTPTIKLQLQNIYQWMSHPFMGKYQQEVHR